MSITKALEHRSMTTRGLLIDGVFFEDLIKQSRHNDSVRKYYVDNYPEYVETYDMRTSMFAQVFVSEFPNSELMVLRQSLFDIIFQASKTMPAEPLLPTDPPMPKGLLYFETPAQEWVGDDVLKVCGIWWHASDDFLAIGSLYNIRGYLHPMSSEVFSWRDVDVYTHKYLGSNIRPIPEETLHLLSHPDSVLPFLKALWSFMASRLAVTVSENTPRPAKRRAQKSGDIVPDTVNVIHLRRTSRDSHDYGNESTREFSMRWLVGGHWRNQWLPSVQSHRQTWIRPYIKGPSDKPFVAKEVVYSIER